jgi:hypothetical protein
MVKNFARDSAFVCVNHLKLLKIHLQGVAGHVIVLQPTKTAMTFYDIDPGRWIDVPASIFMSSSCDGQWLTQEPCRF